MTTSKQYERQLKAAGELAIKQREKIARLKRQIAMNKHLDTIKIFKVANRKYAIFTAAGDYIATVNDKEVKPLMFKPSARADYLAAYKKGLTKSALTTD